MSKVIETLQPVCFLLILEEGHRRSTEPGVQQSGICHSDTPWLRVSRPLRVALLSAHLGTVPGVAFCWYNKVQE